MKIRNGFVSNSSSSSFIVAFPKKPETENELKDILFGKGYTIEEEYKNTYHDEKPTIDFICKGLLKDLYDNNDYSEESLNQLFKDRIENELYYCTERDYEDGVISYKKFPDENLREFLFTNYKIASELLGAYLDFEKEKLKLIKLQDKVYYELKDLQEKDHTAYLKIYDEKTNEFKKRLNLEEKEIVYEAILERCVEEDIKFFKKETTDNFIFIHEYSDHDHFGSIIEYGDIFRKLPYVCISHH